MAHTEDFASKHDPSTLGAVAENAWDEVKDKAKLAEDVLASGVKSSTHFIKKYPLESALVCFGVGVLTGILLKKRD